MSVKLRVNDGELVFAIATASETVTPANVVVIAVETDAVKSFVVGTVSRPSILYVTLSGPFAPRRRRAPKTISPESVLTTFVMVVTHVSQQNKTLLNTQLLVKPDLIAAAKVLSVSGVNTPLEKAVSGRKESRNEPMAICFDTVAGGGVAVLLLTTDANKPKPRPRPVAIRTHQQSHNDQSPPLPCHL